MKSLRNLLTAVAIAALTTACAQVPKLTTELPTGWLKDQNGCAVYHSPGQQNDSVRWSGKCKNGYAEGSGITEWYAYGGLLETDTVPRKRGKLHGSGVVTWWDAGDHYIGATTNDLRDGKGVYVWNNGEIYEGDWVADNRTGHGTLILTNGDRYEGGWVDDMWSGQGTYTTATGRIFQGNINRDNLADSEGTITEPNGERRPGKLADIFTSTGCGCNCGCDATSAQDEEEEPEEDVEDSYWIKDGNGCAVYNSQPQYDEYIVWNGKCENGYAQGPGVLKWYVGGELDSTITGTWDQGKLNGKGSAISPEGWGYEGEFVDDQFAGKGVFTRPDGARFEGNFSNGEPVDTEGLITEPNGKQYRGSFNDFWQ